MPLKIHIEDVPSIPKGHVFVSLGCIVKAPSERYAIERILDSLDDVPFEVYVGPVQLPD